MEGSLRRQLLLAALLAGALPRARSAPGRTYRLGFLGIGDATTFFGADRQRLLDALASLGYTAGRNLEVAECYENESAERLDECARKLAALKVDAIVTEGTAATLAAQKATRTIPVVTTVGDPVAGGFARDLRQPAGNVTGLSQNRRELARKQVELLRVLRPRMTAIALLWEAPLPGIEILMKPVIEAAREVSISTHDLPRGPKGFEKSLEEMRRLHLDAAFTFGGMERADFEAAVRSHVAIVAPGKDDVKDGALFSVEPDNEDAYFLAAAMVDKVLRGANPAQMPFQTATRYLTTLNAKTAATLGIRLTPELRLRADRVIE